VWTSLSLQRKVDILERSWCESPIIIILNSLTIYKIDFKCGVYQPYITNFMLH
jgi:hypothetical protein